MTNVKSTAKPNALTTAIQAEGNVVAKTAKELLIAKKATNKEFQKIVDRMSIMSGLTKGTKAAFWGKGSGEVRMMVKGQVAQGEALGAWQSDMSETIVHCVGVAFLANVPFTRDLKKSHKADGTPREAKREAADGAATTGNVTTTTPEAAEKTARKLILQLRTLGSDAVAAGIVDVMQEFNPAFTETEPAKS